MFIDRNFQLLENNQCPDCMSPYYKTGIGSDHGIHCNHCGYVVPIEKYRAVMKSYFKRINKFDDNEEESYGIENE